MAIAADGSAHGWQAKRVILAAPRFLARHLVRPYRTDPPAHLEAFEYGTWLVAIES
jgi:hypothetical protein